MIRTAENASPNLAPIFKLPRNIVLLLRSRTVVLRPAALLRKAVDMVVECSCSTRRFGDASSAYEHLDDNGCALHASSHAARRQ
jgi:hypothetical protein